jgi:hypothetical protein
VLKGTLFVFLLHHLLTVNSWASICAALSGRVPFENRCHILCYTYVKRRLPALDTLYGRYLVKTYMHGHAWYMLSVIMRIFFMMSITDTAAICRACTERNSLHSMLSWHCTCMHPRTIAWLHLHLLIVTSEAALVG